MSKDYHLDLGIRKLSLIDSPNFDNTHCDSFLPPKMDVSLRNLIEGDFSGKFPTGLELVCLFKNVLKYSGKDSTINKMKDVLYSSIYVAEARVIEDGVYLSNQPIHFIEEGQVKTGRLADWTLDEDSLLGYLKDTVTKKVPVPPSDSIKLLKNEDGSVLFVPSDFYLDKVSRYNGITNALFDIVGNEIINSMFKSTPTIFQAYNIYPNELGEDCQSVPKIITMQVREPILNKKKRISIESWDPSPFDFSLITKY